MGKTVVNKNEVYTIDITDLSHRALGIGHIEGFPIFVENALPGELVEVKITYVGRRRAHAFTRNIVTASPERVEIFDSVHTQNGTMPLQHLSYEAQLIFKQKQVQDALSHVAGVKNFPVKETIGMKHPYGYRNKAQIPVREIQGKLTTGFYRKRSHDLIPIEDFVIQEPEIDQAIVRVRDILRKYEVEAYDEENHSGDIRHIIVRRGHFTEEMMIVFVTNHLMMPHAQKIVGDIRQEIPEVVSIIQNINQEKTNVILGNQSMVLYGQDYYKDELMGHTFKISHQSFYQVNSIQTEKLYQIAADYADLKEDETVVDAYCGIGTMTLALAERAGQVYGVDIVPEAIEDAKTNAVDNDIDNVEYDLGDAGEWLVDKVAAGLHVDVVVVDPPRKGLSKEFIHAVIESQPERMVYVSCNPNTLARDLKILLAGGYDLQKVQPVDMFPQTHHIENVTLLTKQKESVSNQKSEDTIK